ncbi:hypothetical protein [Serratia marcescens]|uniref:hypothetical protein n=1 Tax=Serratia marcescens TaxID=615 RepID=UPI0018666CAC|nr:hypothetical protein [Serratia marcescens]
MKKSESFIDKKNIDVSSGSRIGGKCEEPATNTANGFIDLLDFINRTSRLGSRAGYGPNPLKRL